MRSLPLVLLLALASAAAAKPPEPAPAANPAAPLPSLEERNAVFGEIDELYRSGQKARTADALVAALADPTKSAFHAECYARLGAVLDEMDLPYAALVADGRALDLDGPTMSSVAPKAITLGDKVGDTALLEPVFAKNVGLDVDASTRSRMAYLAAREQHHEGHMGPALGILKMVQSSDPFYPEAKNLEGVVASMQGRPNDALASLLVAQATAEKENKPARLQNTIRLNLARAYFAAENFPRAMELYATVERESNLWPEAQFERAWSHFRVTDINGALGKLETLSSPFFDDWYFPEADLLRIYSLFLLCKFPDASAKITEFQEHYNPALATLREVGSRDAATLFGQQRLWVEKGGRKIAASDTLPRMLTRLYEDEDRFLDSLSAVQHAEDELKRLKNVEANPFAAVVAGWVRDRRDRLIEEEGGRIRDRAIQMAEQLDSMLANSDVSKLDMLQFETRLYEQASRDGSIPEARKVVDRKLRARRGQVLWPFQGEYWADELGYYRIDTKSECPASLQTGLPSAN